MVDFFGDLGEWRRAADGFLRARMCVRAAPDAAVNDAEASATRTALVILESFVVVVPGAAEDDGLPPVVGIPDRSRRAWLSSNLPLDPNLAVAGQRVRARQTT